MTQPTTPLRDVDLGPEGITGFYEKFVSLLGRSVGDVVVITGAWIYLRQLSPAIDYKFSDTMSATMLVRLALLAWTAIALWTLARAMGNGARWLGLESKGMQWAVEGGERRRVTFYRARDQILRCDESDEARRLVEDAAGRRYRKRALWRDGALLAVLVAAYFYMPLAFSYLYDHLSVGVQGVFNRWDIPEFVRLIFLLFGIVPRAVDLAMVLLESAVHASGAQFMPGAKIRENLN